MACKAAGPFDPDINRHECKVSGDSCVFFFPDSKRCAELYGEGPDSLPEPPKTGVQDGD